MDIRRKLGPALVEPVAHNLDIVSHFDLDGRPDTLQLQYQLVGDRSYLYAGHFWSGGVSVVDVTDPGRPSMAAFIAAPNAHTWNIKVQVADGIAMIPCELNLFSDGDPAQAKKGVGFFDVSDPTTPKELSFFPIGGIGVHRSWWDGGKYAYLSAGVDGVPGVQFHGAPEMTRVMTTLDVSDVTRPERVSDFWIAEQTGDAPWPGDGVTVYTHQPVISGDRAYVAYWDGGFAVVDISDRASPRLVSRVNTFPELSDGNTHTALPLPGRDLLVVTEENTANFGGEGPKSIWIYDLTDETHPRVISKLPVPQPSSREPYSTYFERGDRFGPHCLHENGQGTYQSEERIYATYCNAGLRIFDTTDAAAPEEVAFFVPPDPGEIVDPRPYDRLYDIAHGGSRVACSQDVVVDPRGYIYVSGTNDGIWILKEER